MDGDGDCDLVAVASNINRVQVLFNDGTGAFPVRHGLVTGAFPLGVFCADLDGDADLDVMASNFAGASVSVYANPGNGMIAADTTLGTRQSGSYTWAHDLDGDGDLDLSVVDENADSLFIFLNGTSPVVGVEPVGDPGLALASASPSSGPSLALRPNPIGAGARLALSLAGLRGDVEVEIVSVDGRRVARLWDGAAPGARLALEWDGRDARGRAVASGRYFVSVSADGGRAVREIQVVR
jgi:hypothetical protein